MSSLRNNVNRAQVEDSLLDSADERSRCALQSVDFVRAGGTRGVAP